MVCSLYKEERKNIMPDGIYNPAFSCLTYHSVNGKRERNQLAENPDGDVNCETGYSSCPGKIIT